MRERRRSECDREGRSSNFRRKMRPRSGMYGPVIQKCGRRIPYAGRSRFAGPSPCASGRDREESSSTFRRKMRPRSGMHAPSQSIIAVAASPSAAPSRFAGPSCNAPWRRRPSYDLRRAPCDHPDFTSNALREGFVQRFLIRSQNTFSDNTETQTKTQDGQKYFLSAVSLRLPRFSCF
jgi:hypothetical protein